MAQNKGKWIEDNAIEGNHVRLKNDEVLRGRNFANAADVNILKVNASDEVEFVSQPKYNGTPVANVDLVNKAYVLDVLAGLRDPKDAVRAASTANIDIATGGLLTIDGVNLRGGDRVLLKDQTNAIENGIYVADFGAWVRSSDANAVAEVSQGMSCLVSEGNTNARKIYVLTTLDPELNVDPLTFAQAPNPANFLVPKEVVIAVDATVVANGYVDLAHQAEAESIKVFPLGGPKQEYNSDYTVSVVSNVSRITFAGNLASLIADGDTLLVSYMYATA